MTVIEKKINLVPFSEEHLTERYVSWLNDPEVVRHSRQRHRSHTLSDCRDYYLSMINSINYFFAIEINQSEKKHIGNITVTVDEVNNVADIAILIGDRSVWGKGYGYTAWIATCEFLLNEKHIRKVTGGCYSTNLAMKKIMIKAGMIEDGVRRKQVVQNGVAVDIVHYALFNKEVL